MVSTSFEMFEAFAGKWISMIWAFACVLFALIGFKIFQPTSEGKSIAPHSFLALSLPLNPS